MEDRCVCCGDIVPEGRMICRKCENKDAILKELESACLRILMETSVVHPIEFTEIPHTPYAPQGRESEDCDEKGYIFFL